MLGVECVVAGTGYTGEDGVEIAVPVAHAERVARALIAAGIAPCGLGARDTLRLEAALPLHGHELSPDITTLEADLAWVIGWDKPNSAENRLSRLRRLRVCQGCCAVCAPRRGARRVTARG